MKAYLRLPVGLCPDRGRSDLSPQQSVLGRRIEAAPNLIPKVYHLISLLILVFVSCGAVLAQEPVGHTAPAAQAENKAIDLTAQGIQIGEKVPDVTINNIHNYKTSTAKLSDFKEKLLILDFWATWCGACINMIPKMDSLQREFGDKIQFLSVTYQSEKEVLPFLEKIGRQKGEKYSLPIAIADDSLRNLFPHRTLPHYVWIDDEGTTMAITGAEEVNGENIEKAIMNAFVNGQKRDYYIPYNKDQLLFMDGNGGDTNDLRYYSVFSGYKEGLSSGSSFYYPDSSQSKWRVVNRNLTLPWLAMAAYSHHGYFPNNRLIIEVADSTQILSLTTGEDYAQWLMKNAYCYELMLSEQMADQAYRIMQDDIKKFFPKYSVGIENRLVKAYTLVGTGNDFKIGSKGGAASAVYGRDGCKLLNTPIAHFIEKLNLAYQRNLPYPLANATGYDGNIDLEINAELHDLDALNRALEAVNLRFEIGTASTNMLVISDSIRREQEN